ncbi:peptidoglycan-binding protein [Anaerobacillus sp. CMMVII]|uniref:S41 family peptidase n=1 Tax=Anaerobacillus sp. CMMVII TaxID=2755588 RepID=UPI0021B704E7|nr:S41 family peptidase [Anaerobacillus sp. CMMVII]MCT8140177.1 peptidoglycan-binding protein [Anaerobacillus sp. CMMVII]
MYINRKVVAFFIIVALLVGAGGTYAAMTVFDVSAPKLVKTETQKQDPEAPAPEPALDDVLEKFAKAYQIINQSYVEEVEGQKLLEGAIQGMLETLNDPYSVYMDQRTAKQFMDSLDSHFQGIGAEVSMTNGKVTIVAPFRDSPAEKAGLRPNDQIIRIDGEGIEGLSLHEAVLKIRGEKGTVVNLTIERPGVSEPIELAVTRDDIPIETIRTSLIERNGQKIALIEITSFSEGTAQDFAEALEEYEKQGITGLIIDVRGNPGGYLRSVQEIGHLLVPEGEPIVQIEGRNGKRERYISTLKQEKDYPIITLINKGSASASEILAAALKEAGGHDVVGETTFGKGTVQQALQMGDGSEIKLTLYRWLTSSGNNINEVGVEPTIPVKQPDFFYVAPINVEETLKYDMMGEQIKNAQIMLKGLGLEPGRVDGYFGEQTKNAVTAFQRTNDLPATGEIDEKTAQTLQEKIIEAVRDKENDNQLNTAIELILQR